MRQFESVMVGRGEKITELEQENGFEERAQGFAMGQEASEASRELGAVTQCFPESLWWQANRGVEGVYLETPKG